MWIQNDGQRRPRPANREDTLTHHPIKQQCFYYHVHHSERQQIHIQQVLRNIFEFGQDLRDDGIPELGWKPFRVSEPQDMKSSQLCMNRGGAAKQIPYFCHLCQKHSDGIARTNRTVRGKCARICETGSCYHYPKMDSDVIKKILDKKDLLDQTDEARRLSFVCEQLYDGDWDAQYAACDLHLAAFGAKAGVVDVPDEIL
jgi:hypothetical protein